MRILSRNKREIWYANPEGIKRVTDENGLYTGEKVNTYLKPEKIRMSLAISSGANNLGSQGMAELEPYGVVTGYTHRAVTEDINCPIKEQSIIWYGKVPAFEDNKLWEDLETITWQDIKDVLWDTLENGKRIPPNFIVVRRAESLNHLIYYLKEVDIG